MINRSVCIVPGCHNSSAKWAGQRYICGPHWRHVPREAKRQHRALGREVDRQAWGTREATLARQAFFQQWHDVCEPAAIEAAAGL